MRSALITDWLDKYGGAERVLTAICELYQFDYYYAYVNKMSSDDLKKVFSTKNVQVVDSAMLRRSKPYFRYLMPLFPFVVNSFNRQTKGNDVDLVISSSWVLSKGYRQNKEIHVCYLQARNFKYIWEEADLYFKGPLKMLSFIKGGLQKFDIRKAQNPDYLISNSVFVKDWVKKKYDRDSVVIYPPVEVEDFYINEVKKDYYITIGRLEPYKRFDILIDAFNKNGKKLVVIGDGGQLKNLQKMATGDISFLGYKNKTEIKKYLSEAKGFLYAGVEDFGIAIVEALASGIPVIAYEGGAVKEIIEENKNGITFNKQTAASLNDSIEQFEENEHLFCPHAIRHSALKFSKRRFQQEFDEFIQSVTPQVMVA